MARRNEDKGGSIGLGHRLQQTSDALNNTLDPAKRLDLVHITRDQCETDTMGQADMANNEQGAGSTS